MKEQSSQINPPHRPIQFLFYNTFTHDDGKWLPDEGEVKPREWNNITLVMRNWRGTGMDLMIAHKSNIHSCLYLGHYNDGVK